MKIKSFLAYFLFLFLCVNISFANEVILNEKVNVGITFTKAGSNQDLVKKFKLCVSSLLKYATIDINFYIIGDKQSQLIAKNIFSKVKNVKIKYEVILLLFSFCNFE
jgi:hypothetical protein